MSKAIEGITISDDISNNTNSCLYYSMDEFNTCIQSTDGSLAVFHTNIASLGLHIDELDTLLLSSKVKFYFLGISETGLNLNRVTSNIELDGYASVDCLTEGGRGGSRLYISKEFCT